MITMRDPQDGLDLLVLTPQTQSHLFHAIEFMATSGQPLVIVRQTNNGKFKVHQIPPVIKTEYN
jgi:hypothetical protein